MKHIYNMLLDYSIEITNYIENKHIADSLKSDCQTQKAAIKRTTQECIKENNNTIKRIVKEYNINLH